ncbi:MAG: hypothetical protein L0H64_11350 [Pseudonocardia sp.]|nr:hypothetical protein [Pseudonocardia sp.]
MPQLPFQLAIAAAVVAGLSLALPNIAPGVEFMAAEGSPIRLFFGVSEEMNLPTFLSVLILVGTSGTLALAGRLAGGSVGVAIYVAAALVLGLAFDDFAALHERLEVIGGLIAPDGFNGSGYVWVLPASVLAVGLLVAFWQLVRRVNGRARVYLLSGIVVFLGAAMGLETVNGYLDRPGTDGAPLQIVTHLEELVENLGIILVLRGALGMLQVSRSAHGVSVRIDRRAVTGKPHATAEEDPELVGT